MAVNNPQFFSLNRTFAPSVEGTHARENSNKIWFSSHKIVSLSPISENH